MIYFQVVILDERDMILEYKNIEDTPERIQQMLFYIYEQIKKKDTYKIEITRWPKRL